MQPEDNDRLCLTGPGTPGGEMMRRYWHPVGATEELKDLPKLIKVLDEDLVLFRDLKGRPGLLDRDCAHRGTSLEYGTPREEGLMCCYHGWLYDHEGRIIDMPCEPPGTAEHFYFRQKAYPCRELGGLIFAYLGPRETMPELPGYDFLVREDGYRHVSFRLQACNYLQSSENAVDAVHTAILHRTQFPGSYAEIPRFEAIKTDYGMYTISSRAGDLPDAEWQHMTVLVAPTLQIVVPPAYDSPATDGNHAVVGTWKVPTDDSHFARWQVAFVPTDADGNPTRKLDRGNGVFGGGRNPLDRPYEVRQRDPADYEAQVGQGPIARRDKWHWVSSDKAVIMWERILLDSIHAVERGEDPIGTVRDPELAKFVPVSPTDRVVQLA